MPQQPHRNDRFIAQARADYQGKPKRIARCRDRYGEEHVVIEMVLDKSTGPWSCGDVYYLDWIGAEHADQPDEFGDEAPFPNLKWAYVPDTKEA